MSGSGPDVDDALAVTAAAGGTDEASDTSADTGVVGADEVLEIESEAAMRALGRHLVSTLPARALVTLSGELGAGKSVLARAMLRAYGHQGPVPSPTYAIVESYALAARRVAHLDLYRLADPGELYDIGFDEVLAEHDVVLIEWPGRGGSSVPEATLAVRIEHATGDRRRVTLARSSHRSGDAPGAPPGSSLDNAPSSPML